MYGLRFRDQLPPEVAEELDGFVAAMKAFMLREHNDDGSHNFAQSGVQDTISKLIDGAQDRGQWWKHGPWLLDDPDQGDPNQAAILPPKVATGTYNDWAPYGIDTAVVVEIEPDGGDVTLTGIKTTDGARHKRMLLLRNRDNSNSVILSHQDSGSVTAFQFDLPNGEDVELGPDQNIWLYYDPRRSAWSAAITAQASGGITGGVAASGAVGGSVPGGFALAEVTLTDAQIKALNTTPQTLIAGIANKIIIPISCGIYVNKAAAYTATPSWTVRWVPTSGSAITWQSITASLTGDGDWAAMLHGPASVSFTPAASGNNPYIQARLEVVANAAAGGGNAGNTAVIRTLYWTIDA
jgi:hypothetical protein